MTAGAVLTCNIWEYSFANDDNVGGAQPSGTVIYENVELRLQNTRDALNLAIQGFEVSKFFSAIIIARPDMNLDERKHYVEIVSPPNSRYYHDRFRIISSLEANFHPADPRRYLYVNLERSDLAHTEQYQ